ncbi:hypothetical protein AgCh_037537 [Apium graveolens]
MVELWRLNLVMLLLLTLQARMEQGEAIDTCGVQSAYFLGFCLIDHHCEMVCKIEGFPGGQCLGLIPHCICLGTCQQQSPPSPPPVNPPESPPPVTQPQPVYSLPSPSPGYTPTLAADLE